MSHRSLQHDLLFVSAAVEQGCLERDAFAEIFREWKHSGDASIRELLIRHASISHSLAAELDARVDAHLASRVYQPTQEDHPPLETLVNAAAQTDDPERFVRIAAMLERTEFDLDPSDERLRGSRYRILRKHAEGGLGRVVVARDQELAREVALKEIKSEYAADLGSRDRFEREALITGGLEHPGIVPVYGYGKNTDGSPFYAMRFIRGLGFDEAIRSLHEETHGNRRISQVVAGLKTEVYREPAKLFEFRKLLQRFISVCDAIEYAHSRGIVHRDLKPANVMLGGYGETLVVDWGLAKDTGNGVAAFDDRISGLPETVEADFQQTAHGATVGTPSYMSPEQAAGDVARVGPASDVYCLGATLYHLLTGLTPIVGKTISEVLTKARLGDFEPAHRRVQGVPKSLSAICLKAMAAHPDDRYSGPRALADDLEHWLANEPIQVHRETFGERLARWVRRHRAWAQAAGTALAAIIAVLGVAIVLINGQRNTAETQRTRAEILADEKSGLLDVERDLRKKAEWQAANRMYEQSLNVCAQGDAALGLLSLQESLSESVRIGAGDLENSIRMQLARWSHEIHRLSAVTPIDAQIRRMILEPDGKTVLMGTNAGACLAYDPSTGELLPRKYRHDDVVSSFAFTSDGKTLATGGFDRTVRIWNVADESPQGEPLKHDSSVTPG